MRCGRLFDDSYSVAEAVWLAGVPVQLEVWQGLWHVWHAVGEALPETEAAYASIRQFINMFPDK